MPPGGVPGAPRKRPGCWATPPSLLRQQRTRPRPSRPRRGLRPGAWSRLRLRAPRPSEKQPATPRLRLAFPPSPQGSAAPPRPAPSFQGSDLHLKPAPRWAPSWGSHWRAMGTECSLRAGLCRTALSLLLYLGCTPEGRQDKRGAGCAVSHEWSPRVGSHWPGAGRFLHGPPWGQRAKSPISGLTVTPAV